MNRLTPELEQKIYDLVKGGNYPRAACDAVGISITLYNSWIKRGEGRDRMNPPSPEYVTFAKRMREAEAKAEVEVVKMVMAGIPKDPALGLKFLSRRFKDQWGETVKHEVSWVVKAIHMLKVGDVTLEALKAELPEDDYELVRLKYLESPPIDGEYVEIEPKVDVDAE